MLSQLGFGICLREGPIGLSSWWEVLMAGVEIMVRDKYAVRLAKEQREELQRLVRVGKNSARVTARARILLKSEPYDPQRPVVRTRKTYPSALLGFTVLNSRIRSTTVLNHPVSTPNWGSSQLRSV